MEGLEDRVQELSGDLALLRIQLARAQAEKETLTQRLQRTQIQQHTPVAVNTPVRACATQHCMRSSPRRRTGFRGHSLRLSHSAAP